MRHAEVGPVRSDSGPKEKIGGEKNPDGQHLSLEYDDAPVTEMDGDPK